jgi:hypothetical protein
VATHSPHAYVPARHHILPQAWGGKSTEGNLVTLCPTTHTAVHRLLDEYVRNGGDPGWDTRCHFGPYVRDLALRAWDQRPPKPTITSVQHP